jgi:hypothetical protein
LSRLIPGSGTTFTNGFCQIGIAENERLPPKLIKLRRILAQAVRKGNRMKKYRQIKITVKTREIISVGKNPESETQTPVCPVCHAPLTKALLPLEEKRAELAAAPVDFSADREKGINKEN